MHQRDPITSLRLIHEVRGNENGDALLARQLDEQFPELITRHRIDPGRRLIEDEHLRLVDHRHRQREPLPDAERQVLREVVEVIAEPKLASQLRNPRGDPCRRQMKQPRVQVKVLPHRQLRIEREGLRHESDALPRFDVVGINLVAEEPGLTLGGREQSGQHFHRRRLAAAIRTQETEDLPALNAEAHMIHRGEIAEFLGESLRFNRRAAPGPGQAWRHRDRVMTPALLLGQ